MRALIFSIILFSCQEEVINKPIGCECNNGVKLDFTKPILSGFIESIKFEEKHCEGGSYFTCGVYVMIPNHGGFKRYIYNANELNN